MAQELCIYFAAWEANLAQVPCHSLDFTSPCLVHALYQLFLTESPARMPRIPWINASIFYRSRMFISPIFFYSGGQVASSSDVLTLDPFTYKSFPVFHWVFLLCSLGSCLFFHVSKSTSSLLPLYPTSAVALLPAVSVFLYWSFGFFPQTALERSFYFFGRLSAIICTHIRLICCLWGMQAVESSNSRIKQSVPQVRFFLCFKLHENQSISVYGFLEHFGTYQLNHSLTVIL